MELRRAEEEVSFLVELYHVLFQSSRQLLGSSDECTTALLLPPLAISSKNLNENHQKKKNATEILESLETLKQRLNDQQATMDKFRKRLDEKDPVTEKPRYGEKTRQRVIALIQDYETLMQAVQLAFGGNDETTTTTSENGTIVDSFRDLAAKEAEEQKRREREEQALAEKQKQEREQEMERARYEAERAAAERARQEREAAQALRREAQEAREAIRREQEAAIAADRAWIESIPNRKTLEGVQTQIRLLAETGGPSSISALYTIFSQIVSHPEEPNYRRIRRDHPRFLEDIGQYAGGKEILIAAGFELGFVEEVPSFVCKEPNIETDMDGWVAWFDLLKGTLRLIEQEMVR